MPTSRGRRKSRQPKARETQAAQRRAEQRRKMSYRELVIRRVTGWSLVGLGVTVGSRIGWRTSRCGGSPHKG